MSLGVLALGTFTTWLVAGPFGDMLERSLPFHTLNVVSTGRFVLIILTSWSTWLGLAIVALGLGAWWWRDRLRAAALRLRFLERLAGADFGFAWLNQAIVRGAHSLTEALAVTQTGQLNWNVLGIMGGLAIVLAILLWGG
jgi:hypothetical protein